MLDIYFSAILGALGVNLSVFESVFPLVKKLSIGILAIALGIAFYIFIFQISKNLNPSSIDDAESPLSLLASFATAIFSVLAYKPLLNILLSFTTSSLTVLQSSKLTKILKKGLASDMFDSFYDSLVKSSGNKSIIGKVIGTHMPERIAAIILVAYIYSKLYKMTKIILRTYVGVGILTYLAPLPLACLSSRATKGVTKGFLQIYIEHLLSIILNCWFLRIVLNGFGAINFDSLSKMQSSMSGIQKILSDIMTSPVEKKFTTFAVIVVWSLMIGAFIDYAVNINAYIERMTSTGGLSIVPNGRSINPFKDNIVTKAIAAGYLAESITGTPLKSMKHMAGKAWEEKLKSEIHSAGDGNGFFGFGGADSNPKNPNPSPNGGGPNGGGPENGNPKNGSGGTAMGGSKPRKQKENDGKKAMEPFSPAAENAKQAGMYSLLHQPLSGKEAKKKMAEAMNGNSALMDPYGEGKDYLDQLKNGMSKEDQEKLDNSLVFDSGNDGIQIMSDIESDGNGTVTAKMNGEDIELHDEESKNAMVQEGKAANAIVNIAGQELYYDSNQCPNFHKMVGGIDFGEPTDTSFADTHTYNPGSSQTYDDFVVGGNTQFSQNDVSFDKSGNSSSDILRRNEAETFSGANHSDLDGLHNGMPETDHDEATFNHPGNGSDAFRGSDVFESDHNDAEKDFGSIPNDEIEF